MTASDEPTFSILDLAAELRNAALREDLQRQTESLKKLLAASDDTQQEILEFRERYERLPSDTPLAPRSLRAIHAGRSLYLTLQGRLIALARRYKPLLDLPESALAGLRVDPVLRARGVLASFAAALTLYDNYLSMRTILEDGRLRRLISHPTRGYGLGEEKVVEIIRNLNTPGNRRRLRELVGGYDRFSDQLAAMADPHITFLQKAVEASVSYRYARTATLGRRLPSSGLLRRERVMDALDELGKSALGTLSEIFGNGIGLVETRKGKLWQSAQVEQDLLRRLEPLDMLLEKTPFRLTDSFIPGHFGHVAVWVGTATELQDRGLWQDPLFKEPRYAPCVAAVADGRSVLEALRSGVQLSSMAEFLNVDDLAVLRPRGLSELQVRESLLRSFQQIGKQYDFNFEVETVGKITCSELPYHVYPGVDWETDEQLGQFTISPDQVAAQALGEDAPFELLDFYHDGERVDSAEASALMRRLMAEG